MSPPTAPYSEPLLPQLDVSNPYYTPLHHNLRASVRNYIETSITPYAQEWETAGAVPEPVRRRYCELGFGIVHPLTTPEDAAGISLPGNVPREKWDTWCSLIVTDELTRTGFVGVVWGLGGGNAIGCPPVAKFGTEEQRRWWLPSVARGDVRFCLGITEPDGKLASPLPFFGGLSSADISCVKLDQTSRISKPLRSERAIITLSMERRNGSPMAFGRITARLLSGLEDQAKAGLVCL